MSRRVTMALCLGLIGALTCVRPAWAGTFRQIYDFAALGRGRGPMSELLPVNGLLYGTTPDGGAGTEGTVFAVDPVTGAERVVYSFGVSKNDGGRPQAGLVELGGLLYGTTIYGPARCSDNANGCGTVFAVDPVTGVETILYAFKGGRDGTAPQSTLTVVDGKLIGTTSYGGGPRCSCGTVFSLDPATGIKTILYTFEGQAGRDGATPIGALIEREGVLYGTTEAGGRKGCPSGGGCGTVFSFDLASKEERLLYAFRRVTDGARPQAGVLEIDGRLYGTASIGGSADAGTVFSLDLATGVETVLHNFQNGRDGAEPLAGLTRLGGLLYGTTQFGGPRPCKFGCGTVFAVVPSGSDYRVLYHFHGTDGSYPHGALLAGEGLLYGTTQEGGPRGPYGLGTVFSLSNR
jgi:uncharacterized repeat protein (TIGR03803 family)